MSGNIEEQKKLIVDAILDLNRKLNAIKVILEEIQEPKGRIALEIFDELIDSIYFLLWESVVVNLSWLYERTWQLDKNGKSIKKKHTRSLYWYLEEQKNTFPTKTAEFNSQIAKIDALEATVKKLRSVRDQWVVHRDKKALENPDKFLKNVGLKFEDVTLLINTSDEIIKEHVPVTDHNSFGISRLFWAIEYADMLPSKIEEIEQKIYQKSLQS